MHIIYQNCKFVKQLACKLSEFMPKVFPTYAQWLTCYATDW